MDEKKSGITQAPPGEIESDIARTRREISGTIGEIRERLSTGHMKEQTKEKIRASRFGQAASRFGERARGTGSEILGSVKSDPIPLAMVGLGIAWFLYSRKHPGGNGALADRRTALKNKAEEYSGMIQEKAGEFGRQARERGSEFADRAKMRAESISTAARERARETKYGFENFVYDNPFMGTVAAFAAGALLGFLIPGTLKEQEMMGSASDRLLSRAKETAQEKFYKAEHAAEKGFETAKDEFKT